MNKTTNNKALSIEVAMHLFAWLFIFISPLLFINRGGNIDWHKYFHGCMLPLFGCLVFYINYLLLIPRQLLKDRKRVFFLYEALLILIACVAMNFILQNNPFAEPTFVRPPRRFATPPRWIFHLRDGITLILFAGAGIAIRLSREWYNAEAARKEAELKNLRNQLNPHFLLNTLNNIYALTAIDANKAQETILELSNLLRYVLYDNQQKFVDLHKEIEFLQTYIELMRIRTLRHVDIDVQVDLQENEKTLIAPLIFISLVENAFKHGISPTKPSYINIRLTANKAGQVICRIENTNFPKNSQDKSGSGIGLQQVQQRLDLLYPGRYVWVKGTNPEQTIYTSSLTINTR